jgi:hypothetical protein
MRERLEQRDVRYRVEDGDLVRLVNGAGARGYEHRCSLKTYETVAHAVAETPAQGEGTSLTDVVRREGLPYTQVNVALEFLKERGIVEVRHRRCYPATGGDVYLDAMCEFHALVEEPRP